MYRVARSSILRSNQATDRLLATIRCYATQGKKLNILYGSQTGTAESIARTIGMFGGMHQCQISMKSLESITAEDLVKEKDAHNVFVLSTYGSGELPPRAAKFYQSLAGGKDLSGVRYSVFGLGNSTFDDFNAASKLLDQKLADLKAQRVVDLGLGDEQAREGHQAALEPWMQKLWKAMASGDAKMSLPSSVTVTNSTKASQGVPLPAGFTKATVAATKLMTPADAPRKSYFVRLTGSNMQYNLLDHVLVQPKNSSQLVDRALKRLKLDGSQKVEIQKESTSAEIPSRVLGKVVSIRELLTEVIDISGVPSRAQLYGLSVCATDPKEREQLQHMSADMQADNAYIRRQNLRSMSLVDILEEYPSIQLSLAQLITNFPELRPRTYSICSDPSVVPGAVEVVYNVHQGVDFTGVTTGFLSGLKANDEVVVKIQKSGLGVPKDDELLATVALGTGVAPVRAILQRRLALHKKQQKVAHVLMYYGIRSQATEFLFKEELQECVQAGILELKVACSHEVPDKYETPLDLIDAKPRVLHDMLRSGAKFLYCGLGGSIPKMVEGAVQHAIQACKDLTLDVRKLREQGRYIEEFFSTDVDAENAFKALYGNKGAPMATKFGETDMFCFQCEQTYHGTGCTKVGVCGKQPTTSDIQDLLVHMCKMLGWYQHRGQQLGVPANVAADRLLIFYLFSTMTNVNFSNERMANYCKKCWGLLAKAKRDYEAACKAKGVPVEKPDAIMPNEVTVSKGTFDEIAKEGKMVGVLEQYRGNRSEDAESLAQVLMYGLKGLSAYADHARGNNQEDPSVFAFVNEACAFLVSPEKEDLGKALAMCMKCGTVNIRVMELLYQSNKHFGTPTPTAVSAVPVEGKCILVSGHDLVMLNSLLEATKGTGIKVYTHGEMLPCHAYPKLKEHGNLAGHFGGPWNRQSVEFPHFPGPIVLTTNCLTEPKPSYSDRLWTMGPVGWDKIPHLGDEYGNYNWKPVIAKALECKGFTKEDKKFGYPATPGIVRPDTYTVGFGHDAVLGAAGTVLEAIKAGDITRFYVVGGCDGYEGIRSYYSDLIKELPSTSVVLTLGCGKYRVNHHDLGTIGKSGIPRILDAGQCNDTYSALQIALALAGALKCEVKDLPLSIVLSWFEQKAVAVLLSLLSLGLKPIRVGPHVPAFFSPAVIDYLVKNCGIMVVDDPAKDAKAMSSGVGMA